jgi:hypothetical protein
MIVGHLAFAYISKRTFFSTESYPLLILASYGPDILDKSLSLMFGLPGRNLGHSLVVLLALVAAAWVLSQALGLRKRWITACAVMWLAHLAGDFVRPVILFWPLLGSFTGDPFAFPAVLVRMYVELRWPAQLAFEIFLVFISLCLMFGLPGRLRPLAAVRAWTEEKAARR